jgi:phage-related protein
MGGYMLVKHWDGVSAFFVGLWNKITGAFSTAFDWIRTKLAGVSDWVLGAVAIFLPFIGIPGLIIKHWDTIAAFFVGLWMRITGGIVSTWEGIKTYFTSLWDRITATFMQAWNAIPAFFSALWNGIVSVVITVANWFSEVWASITSAFSAAWTWASNLFASVWNGIVGIVTGVATWFGEVFGSVTGTFVAAWTWVSDLFVSIWEGIKGVVMGFVEWLRPVIAMIIAPFKAIGDAIGGIINTVKGWLGETVAMGTTELTRMNENRGRDASARPVQTDTAMRAPQTAASLSAPSFTASVAMPGMEPISGITAPSLATTSAVSTPSLTASVASTPAISTGSATAGMNAALMEHFAAASRKGITGREISTAGSDAFMNVGNSLATANASITPTVDMGELNQQAQSSPFLNSLATTNATITPTVDMGEVDKQVSMSFPDAMPRQQQPFDLPVHAETSEKKAITRTITVQNVNINVDELSRIAQFVHRLEHAVLQPEEIIP